ncbi:MAG: hypothetical protein F6K45_20180 [Kamptonema sp. SIO1D9]|nr:hypothetical protein [Kamptonema sp. SIO1D9]
MSLATALNNSEIQEISQPRQVSSSRLQYLARKIEALSVAVETKWNEFSPQERELIEALIYDLIELSQSNENWFADFFKRLFIAWVLLRTDLDSFLRYQNAVQRLKNSVLDAIEKSHPDYEEKIAAALEEALVEIDNSPAMTQDEFSEWLTSISD